MHKADPTTQSDAALIADVIQQINAVDARVTRGVEELGGYQILGILGQGGMGIVYRARQKNPARDVALKVLRSGLISADMLRRFEKEAQVLGRLHHIGIAQIYEAGAADSGFGLQPFFALELVEGLPVTDHCEANKLDTRARLALVARICDAVEHAHQNNVIHRDLKPSNIMVDESGHPKVLDFGVARVIDAEAQAATMRTEARKLVGTLPYMSPEQVCGASRRIDKRTDIYSLGVLTYRLLTGRYPHHVSQTSIPESIRAIQDGEPTRLSLIDRSLRGDVETIVAKAMEKDPARRYASCADLGADVRRFLNNEPIRARPAGHLYRLSKFTRRNRALVVSAVSVFFALSAGLALTGRASSIARHRLEDFRRLADARDLELYKAEARRLWPAHPDNINGMIAWLAKADALRQRLASYRRQLDELHERAIERNLVKQLDRDGVRLTEELFEVRNMLAHAKQALAALPASDDGDASSAAEESAILKAKIGRLRVEERRIESLIPNEHICRFTDRADVLQHDILVELVQDMNEFFDPLHGTYNDMKQRLYFAQKITRLSIEDHAAAWKDAIAAIRDRAASPQYDGLVLTEQIGLVPLGPDRASGLWEFAHVQTGKIPVRDEAGTLQINEDTGLVFVLIPGGLTTIGAHTPATAADVGLPYVDPMAAPEEQPVQTVTLSPFFMSKFEMTQAQWRRVAGRNPSRFQDSGIGLTAVRAAMSRAVESAGWEMCPVENVSWLAASELLWQLGLALPTEAQWEYAARGWTFTPWWTGATPDTLSAAANMADIAYFERGGRTSPAYHVNFNDGFGANPAPVGMFRANPFGLHDILGNVAEWCFDAFGDYDHPTRNGTGKREAGRGESAYRVFRGGSYADGFGALRSAARGRAAIEYRAGTLGVRPVRELNR